MNEPMMIISNEFGTQHAITLESVEWHIDAGMFCEGVMLEYAE